MTCCKSTSTGVGIPTTAPSNNDPDIYIEQPSGQIWVWNGTQWISPTVGAVSYNEQTRVLTVGSSSVALPIASKTAYGMVKLSSDTNNPLVVAPDGSITIDCSKLITHCNLATKADLTTAVNGIVIPTSLQPTGAAGGDLEGTYPNPTVKQATTTTAGKVELATKGETVAGTRDDVAVTPAGVAAAVGEVADTNTSIASVLAPTGTPAGSGTHYVTNSNGEVFMYNAATGTWVLIANGYHMTSAAEVNIDVPNFGTYRTAVFTMPRAGWVNLTSFSEASAEAPVATPTGESRLATSLKVLQNGGKVYMSDMNISHYAVGDGVRHALAGMIGVAAGDVIEVFFEQNNIPGANVNLRNYNTQLHYLM